MSGNIISVKWELSSKRKDLSVDKHNFLSCQPCRDGFTHCEILLIRNSSRTSMFDRKSRRFPSDSRFVASLCLLASENDNDRWVRLAIRSEGKNKMSTMFRVRNRGTSPNRRSDLNLL